MSYEEVNRATPAGMVLSEDGAVLNWRGVNYVRQDAPTADGPMSYDREAIAQAVKGAIDESYTFEGDLDPSVDEAIIAAVIEVLPPLDAPTDPAPGLEVPADDASTVGEPPEHVVEAVAEWLRDEYGVYGGVAKQEAHHLIAFIRDAGGPAAPSDEVLIDDTDYVSWSGLAEYAANQKRAAGEARREAKNYYLKLKELESAVTEPMPAPTIAPDAETITRVLRDHQEEATGAGLIKCQCADTAWFDTPSEMAAHQARVVASADPRRTEAEVREQVAREIEALLTETDAKHGRRHPSDIGGRSFWEAGMKDTARIAREGQDR